MIKHCPGFFRLQLSLALSLVVSLLSFSAHAGMNEDLLQAAREGNISQVTELIRKGADVNAKDDEYGFTSLIKAAANGHTNIVKLLLDKGADINAEATARERLG